MLMSEPSSLADKKGNYNKANKDNNGNGTAYQYQDNFGLLFLHKNATTIRMLSNIENAFETFLW